MRKFRFGRRACGGENEREQLKLRKKAHCPHVAMHTGYFGKMKKDFRAGKIACGGKASLDLPHNVIMDGRPRLKNILQFTAY